MKRAVSPMKGKMKVILRKDLLNIGKVDDVKIVRNGFYLNYLLPNNYAEKATPRSLDKLAAAIKSKENEQQRILDELEALKTKIETLGSIKIFKTTGSEGRIFGSVPISEFLSTLEAAIGQSLGAVKVSYADISSVGLYSAEVTIHQDVTAKIGINVQASE